MRTYYRWAVLAGAVVLAFSNTSAAWADELVQGGATMETATLVPEFQNSQAAGTETTAAPVPVSDTVSGSTSSGTGTRVIRTGDGTQNQAAETAANSGQQSQNTSAGSSSGGSSSTRVIRTTGGSGQTSGQSSGSQTSSGNVDYSAGPGAFNQPQNQAAETTVVAAADDGIQIYDVTNPIVVMTEKYSYDQMVSDMNRLKERYGNKIQINGIGTSLDGRTIFDCIIGNPSAPKQILIQGGIHGREYLNPMLMMQQMELALANYDSGSFHNVSLSSMFDQVAIHFVPMSNPDGVTISQFGIDGIRSQELKDAVSTCYVMDTAAGRAGDLGSYLSKWKANARGVDLNLNFDALWQNVNTTEFPSYSGYRGSAPGTEPETQALMNLYQNPQYPWKAVIHYHSMGDVIYWDILGNKVQAESAELANLMSAATGGYQLLPSEGGGGYKDWIQLGNNPVPSVTLETGKVACPMPLSEYPMIWSQNRLTWAVAMEWVMNR